MGITNEYADCIVLTYDNKILLQQRPENERTNSGALCAFGGHIEAGETVMQALIRELHEELGAIINPDEVIFIGTIKENSGSLVHIHFWHDKKMIITGCYEWEAKEYDTVREALSHPKIMDYASWALLESQKRGLIK